MTESTLPGEWVSIDELLAGPTYSIKAECTRCGRKTCVADQIGVEDKMPQPNGQPCGGTFVRVTA